MLSGRSRPGPRACRGAGCPARSDGREPPRCHGRWCRTDGRSDPRQPPVLERDRQLEGAGHLAQELLLVNLQEAMKGADRRHGGLTDADRADLLGLDQRDLQLVTELMRQRAAGQPSRCTATGNDHLADAPCRRALGIQRGALSQRLSLPSSIARMRRARCSSNGARSPRAGSGRCCPRARRGRIRSNGRALPRPASHALAGRARTTSRAAAPPAATARPASFATSSSPAR